jgi:hypothetical protein
VQQGAFRFDLRSGVVDPVDPKTKTVDLRPMTPDLNKNERLPGLPDVQFRSSDNAHVLVSKPGADNRVWDRYEWTLVDSSSSDRVGQFSNHQSHAPFLVIDQTLLFESTPYKLREGDNLVSYPLEIRAVDLSTGQLRWRHPVRDTTYEGDLPP